MNDAMTLPTREQMAKLLNEQEARQEAILACLTVPPCPAWCAYDDGHPYESFMDDAAVRLHRSRPNGEAWVSVLESNLHNVVTADVPEIELCSGDRPMGIGRAHVLAADLQAAIELLRGL